MQVMLERSTTSSLGRITTCTYLRKLCCFQLHVMQLAFKFKGGWCISTSVPMESNQSKLSWTSASLTSLQHPSITDVFGRTP